MGNVLAWNTSRLERKRKTMKPLEMQETSFDDWLKVASGINTPENRAKWPNYRNRGGAGPCEYCGEDSPWFTCRRCDSMTCRNHHLAFIDNRGAPIAYCVKCDLRGVPLKFKKILIKMRKP